MTEYELRLLAVKRYLAKENPVKIYSSLNRSKAWLFKWIKRYKEFGEPGLEDKSKRPTVSPNKTMPEIEHQVVSIRKMLVAHATKETFYSPVGTDSISWELEKLGIHNQPSTRTINRILKRNGLLDDCNKTQKRNSGILYPNVTISAPNDVHQLDPVGPRYLKGLNGVERFHSINLVDCFSKVAVLRQHDNTRNSTLAGYLIKDVWPTVGLSKVLQVDNMLSVKGSNRYPRSPGLVIRLCLLFGVEILFIPINEPQRNGAIESFNKTFNKVFYQRQKFDNLNHLQKESLAFEDFYCNRRPHSKLSKAKHGSRIPGEVHKQHELKLLSNDFSLKDFMFNGQIKIPLAEGKISFIRWIDKRCNLNIFSENFALPESHRYCYVKATILTKEQILQVWHDNILIKEIPYYLMD